MSLQNQSMSVLKLKVLLLRKIIEENSDDPRVINPKEQLRIIEEEIERRNKEPQDLVVGLKTLELNSKIQRGK